MKKIVFLVWLVASLSCKAQSAEGSMDCTVTGNVVVASEEGKFKSYSSIQGGVKANEKVTLSYRVSSDSIYIGLERQQAEKKIIINAYLSTDKLETKAEKNQSGGFIVDDTNFKHSVSFLPDYIRIKDFNELFIKRYYKNDWHGIYSAVYHPDSTTQTLTLNCRHTNDKMDAAFKVFTGYKGHK
jgi:hypothetical protein